MSEAGRRRVAHTFHIKSDSPANAAAMEGTQILRVGYLHSIHGSFSLQVMLSKLITGIFKKNMEQSESSETSLSGLEFSSNNRLLTFPCNTHSLYKTKVTSLCQLSPGSLAAWADDVAVETSTVLKDKTKKEELSKGQGLE